MPDVFISYSSKDEERAQLVRKHLLAHDLDVFLASISLTPGERWTEKIHERLRASEWVFLLASKNALASPTVQLEVGGAILAKKKLVPIMWDVPPAELPRWISDFQGLNLTDATMEGIDAQVGELAARVKAKKVNGQLVAGAVLAVALFFLSRG